MGSDHVPDWFWEVLEATRPRLSALELWLGSQPREILEAFALAYESAADSLADFSEGVSVDGDVWSEDSTEDLCMWVVGQGCGLWNSVIAGEVRLEEVAQMYLGRARLLPDCVVPWAEDVSTRSTGATSLPGPSSRASTGRVLPKNSTNGLGYLRRLSGRVDEAAGLAVWTSLVSRLPLVSMLEAKAGPDEMRLSRPPRDGEIWTPAWADVPVRRDGRWMISLAVSTGAVVWSGVWPEPRGLLPAPRRAPERVGRSTGGWCPGPRAPDRTAVPGWPIRR